MLLRKCFQAALNASTGRDPAMRALVREAWEVLSHVIHEGGPKAKNSAVSHTFMLLEASLV